MNGIMNFVGTSADAGSQVGKELLRLDVLAVYEDFGTGLRARQTLDQTVQRLEADADVRVNLWRFDLLREPALRQQAAEEAAEADIVFVSMHGQGELPACVNLWFAEWFGRRSGEPCALVVSLDGAAKDTSSATQIMEALGAAARLAGVDLFLHLGEAQTELKLAAENTQGRAETSAIVLDQVQHRAEGHQLRDWGINE